MDASFCKLKPTLEASAGDALVQVLLRASFVFVLPTGDGQQVVVELDTEFVVGKAGHGQRDAVLVLLFTDDVVGRIALSGALELERRLHQSTHSVEADGGPKQGCEVVGTHDDSSLSESLRTCSSSHVHVCCCWCTAQHGTEHPSLKPRATSLQSLSCSDR